MDGARTIHIPRNMLVQWHITDRCNLRCRHCYQEDDAAADLPLDDLLAIHRQIVAMIGDFRRRQPHRRLPCHVTITGGEPLVRDDLVDLLTALVAEPTTARIAILTNGTLIDDAMARRLAALRPAFVQVSLEGTRATHESIRGEDTFDRAVDGIRHLVRHRVHTLISFSAHRGNLHEFGDVARLGVELGVARVWCDRLIPNGRGAQLAADLLTPAETRELFERMLLAQREAQRAGRRTEINMGRALQFLVGGGTPYRCTAGDTLLTILPRGDLLPCRRLPLVVGNVLETPLTRLYQESDLLKSLRNPPLPDDCRACLYRNACSGGLRCLSYATSGHLHAIDPGCWRPGQMKW